MLLQSIRNDLLTEESVAEFKAEAVKLLAEHRRSRKPDQAKAQARLHELEAEIAHIMAAIKQGILTVTTKAALEQAEADRTRLLPMLQAQQKKAEKVSTFLPNMADRFKTLVEGLATVTQQQVDRARGQLRELIGGQIRLHASSDGVERFLTAEVAADYFGLINLVFGPKINLVAVSRIERETRGL